MLYFISLPCIILYWTDYICGDVLMTACRASIRHGLPHCRLVRCCIHQFTAATENSNKLKHSRMPFARASLRPAELLMMLSPLRLARTCIFLAQCASTSDILLVDWHNAFHSTVQSLADAISIVVGAGEMHNQLPLHSHSRTAI